jgi:hypothetical protein
MKAKKDKTFILVIRICQVFGMQSKDVSSFRNALPFWMSLALLPLVWAASFWGGWSFLIIVVLTWNF